MGKKKIFDFKKWRSISLMITTGVSLLSVSLYAQDGAALFKQNCGVCHKVGGGRMVGPDLMGVTEKRSEEWLLKWTKSSQSFIKSGDADAKAIFDEFGGLAMPDQNLPDVDLKAIYSFIASKSAPAASSSEPVAALEEIPQNASVNATADDIAFGKSLFEGSNFFSAGGPSCISCHNVNYNGLIPGGLLAKDLTNAYSRLGGDAGLQGILGAPPFPAMTEAYKSKNLSDKEIFALTAFLNKVDSDKANQIAGSQNILLYGGVAGLIGILILAALIWIGRKKNTVKKDIYNRQLKSI